MKKVGSLIATSALFAGALYVAGCGGSGHPDFGTMSQLRSDRVSAVIDVGGAPDAPDWQAQATDAVWVANSDKRTIQRIDPKTNRVTAAPVTIKQPCAGLVVAFASVWSEDCDQNELVRVDERSGRELARIPVIPADSEGLLTATQTAVYVVSKDASSVHYFVAKVDPTTNKIVRKIPVEPGAVAAAAGFGSVWVTNPFAGTVTRNHDHTVCVRNDNIARANAHAANRYRDLESLAASNRRRATTMLALRPRETWAA